jgi:alcohol dehydrogenase (cytochrome c)
LFLATLDAHLLALDKKTGAIVWDTEIADYRDGYTATAAPLIVKDKIIVGIAGAEFATRGFLDAYSIETGERLWRFWTVPAPGEPGSETWLDGQDAWKRGGGTTWVTGSYDPELNLLYWGTGNPAPDFNASVRPGDNLYTNSIIAVDADTGKLKWHFQPTPGDTHDWDSVSEPILAELTVRGEKRQALLQANRNGFFYALDRATGRFLQGFPFVHQTWARGLDANGRPLVIPGMEPTENGQETCPSMGGGKNWNHIAYNPETGLVYVPVGEGCDIFFTRKIEEPEPFVAWFGSVSERSPANPHTGALRAYDPANGKMAWEYKTIVPLRGSALTTAGDLVFIGDTFGFFSAFHARNGKVLWKMNTGADASNLGNIVRGVVGPPVTYLLDGRQHVAIIAGGTMYDFALPAEGSDK